MVAEVMPKRVPNEEIPTCIYVHTHTYTCTQLGRLSIRRLVTKAMPHEPFSEVSLLLAASTYLILLMFTFGAPIPAGLFMPWYQFVCTYAFTYAHV
jgi:hypothetical protein